MQAYCIVGARRGIGKTKLIEKIIEKLRERNVKVYTVKKSSKRIDIAEKDTSRHLNAGASLTLAVSPQDAALFLRETDINKLIKEYIPKNGITLIEGFKESKYPKIIIIETLEDLGLIEKLDSKFIIVCKDEEIKKTINQKFENLTTCTMNEIDFIANMIIDDAIIKIFKELPKVNCGLCGYQKCIEYARAIIHGEKTGKCPLKTRVKISVDGEEMRIKPYVETICRKIIEGFLSSLKGFDERYKNIKIELKREQ
ncbi:MAG: molybdopterin-guanine dinucleotide biosynthesis protein B [archaeon GB-1867-035]|nr:molybdopterin-guanine dinucleotide biosynthesis protein B [Candidatus Culexmicrobium profundum]